MEHDQNFTGTINRTAAESTIAWTSEPSPLRQSPNIVMIVLDDVGYAEFGCYGSDVETPALDSLAADGLRYANFHVTPLCSPTRTCLLTGRNHHSVGMGRVAEMVNGFPNTRGFVSPRGGQPGGDAASTRVPDPRGGQMAPGFHPRDQPRGPLQPLAPAAGFRPLPRLPRRARQTSGTRN